MRCSFCVITLLALAACDMGGGDSFDFVADPSTPAQVKQLVQAHVARFQRFQENPMYHPRWAAASGAIIEGDYEELNLRLRAVPLSDGKPRNEYFTVFSSGSPTERANGFLDLVFAGLTTLRQATPSDLAVINTFNNWSEGRMYSVPYEKNVAIDGSYKGEPVTLVVVWQPGFPSSKFQNAGWAEKADDIIDIQAVLVPADGQLDAVAADTGWARIGPVATALLENQIQIGHWAQPL